MIGEIRDLETAQIAVQASLTGPLVLGTLHTNTAAAAIPRLINLGVPHYYVADVLRAVLSQRLVRATCRACGQPAPIPETLRAPGPAGRSWGARDTRRAGERRRWGGGQRRELNCPPNQPAGGPRAAVALQSHPSLRPFVRRGRQSGSHRRIRRSAPSPWSRTHALP
jgi:hypothetical protein